MEISNKSHAFYDIVNQSANGIYVIEQQSCKLLYVNKAMAHILDMAGIHNYLGEKCYRTLKQLDEPCSDCLANPTGNEGENRELFIDFLSKYYSVSTHPLQWAGTAAYVVYLSDISQEKMVSDEVKQLYNNIPGAVFRCKMDKDMTVISANDGLFELLGYTREEFKALGNKMSAVICPEDFLRTLSSIIPQLSSNAATAHITQRLICKDKSIKWSLARGQLLAGNGEERVFYCVLVDISEQKSAQLELDKTRKKLSAAIDHAGLAYWEYDMVNNVAYLNPNTKSEYSLEQTLPNYPQSLYDTNTIYPESIETFNRLIQAVKSGEKTASADIKTINAKGALAWRRVRFTTLFDEGGKPFWAVATAESINDYKELENRFSTVLEQNNIDTWLFDIKRSTIIQNHNTEGVYGVHAVEIPNVPEALIEKKLCYHQDADIFRDFYNRLKGDESQVTATVRLWDVRKQTYVWKRCTYTVVPSRVGGPAYALGSAVDVSDQVEVKQKYEDAIKARYSTLSENVILAGHCNLTKNIILEVEDKTGLDVGRRFGMVREEFFNGIASLIPNEEQRKVFCQKFLNEGMQNSFELGITQDNYDCTISLGSGIRWISVHVDMALQPLTEDIIGFLTVTDVSAGKMQQQVLDSVIQFDYDYVAHLNLNSDTMVFYSSKNQSSEFEGYKYGVSYSYTNAINRTAEKFITQDNRPIYLENMSIENVMRRLSENESYEFTYHMINQNGELRTKQARFVVHDREAGIVVFSRADVSDVLEQQEKQKTALSESLTLAQQ
ncbi:MAG: PAS domain-containing protein, partial [Oscillospiraceae bacterium]